MIVLDILKHIENKEGVYNYTQIPLKRWSEFQKADIKKHIDFEEDSAFEDFYLFVNSKFKSRVNRPTAIKILNNGYFI